MWGEGSPVSVSIPLSGPRAGTLLLCSLGAVTPGASAPVSREYQQWPHQLGPRRGAAHHVFLLTPVEQQMLKSSTACSLTVCYSFSAETVPALCHCSFKHENVQLWKMLCVHFASLPIPLQL